MIDKLANFFVLLITFLILSSQFAYPQINSLSLCDSVIELSTNLRHKKDFTNSILLLENSISDCPDLLTIYTTLAITYIEKADNIYNENGKQSKKERKSMFLKALDYARSAIQIDSTDKLALEYTSLAYAGILSVSNLYDQAHLADSVRIYAEKIIKYDDTNDRAYHILGRWHYEVANLGWFVKFLSKIFLGNSPDGSFNQSIYYFSKAVELDDYVVHNYWLGMAYYKNGNKELAKKSFLHILNLNNIQHNDDYFKQKSKEMLETSFK
ncbi:hypothetical protein EP331_10280 [bacterium]|nr:MAG: hypothetical protein EP331_10280 [bacterium]